MVIHQKDLHRFIIKKPEGLCYMEYKLENQTCTVLHTVVPDACSGQGLAGELAKACYDWVVSHHYILKSDCSYMTAWLKKYH